MAGANYLSPLNGQDGPDLSGRGQLLCFDEERGIAHVQAHLDGNPGPFGEAHDLPSLLNGHGHRLLQVYGHTGL